MDFPAAGADLGAAVADAGEASRSDGRAWSMEGAAIQRHKTAIRRGDFSRPVKCLLRDGLVAKGMTFFDYGCGRGEDIELLTAEGVLCGGWDPAYRPDTPRQEADVVHLGYVLNVIDD